MEDEIIRMAHKQGHFSVEKNSRGCREDILHTELIEESNMSGQELRRMYYF